MSGPSLTKKSNSGDDRFPEPDRQFMERTGIGDMMKAVMNKVIANRPEDPITFIAEYFDSLEDQSNLVHRAAQILMMTHHSRPVFNSNVKEAFTVLSKHKGHKKPRGINGAVFTELIKVLCRNIPEPVQVDLIKKIQLYDFEAVPYHVFQSGVFTCCVIQDYVRLAESLYRILDIQRNNKADKVLCEVALDQLKVALVSSRNDPRRIMESSYNLSPDGLYGALDRAVKSDHKNQSQLTTDQFVVEACDVFLQKVKKFK